MSPSRSVTAAPDTSYLQLRIYQNLLVTDQQTNVEILTG